MDTLSFDNGGRPMVALYVPASAPKNIGATALRPTVELQDAQSGSWIAHYFASSLIDHMGNRGIRFWISGKEWHLTNSAVKAIQEWLGAHA